MHNWNRPGVQVNRRGPVFLAILLELLLIVSGKLAQAEADARQEFIKKLNNNSNSQISFVAQPVFLSDSPTIDFQGQLASRPASLTKLLTAYVALQELGRDFQFSLDVNIAGEDRGGAVPVTLSAQGTPDLVIEDLLLLARKIFQRGIKRVSELNIIQSPQYLDHLQGPDAYQGQTSSLSLNYNSLGFEICPGERGLPANVTLDLPEMPHQITGRISTVKKLTRPLILDLSYNRLSKDWTVKVAGEILQSAQCEQIYKAIPEAERVFAPIFAKLLAQQGIEVLSFKTSYLEDYLNLEPTISYKFRLLGEVLQRMNRYSSNFIAKQLALALAQKAGRVSLATGVNEIVSKLKHDFYEAKLLQLADPSGLSTDNRVSAELLVAVLRKAANDPRIAVEFENSLVYPGQGTLRNRSFGEANVGLRVKTGFINGVSGLAGYVTAQSGVVWAFALIQNQVLSRELALAWEEDLLEEFYRRF